MHRFVPKSPSGLAEWSRIFAVGSLVHLTLPDIEQAGWGPPALLELAGALILLIRPHPIGFALCLVGTAWPLYALRDVLTQSAMLTAFAGAGLAASVTGWRGALDTVRGVTAATYGLAVLHKINTAFFDPATSCANHAWAQVVGRYAGLELVPLPEMLLPWVAVAIEAALAVAVWRRSRWMWPLGLIFHLPLTVTLAPAFAAVMFIGYAAALSPRDRVLLRRGLRRPGPIIALAAVGGLLELLLADPVEPAPLLKVIVAGGLLAWTATLFGRRWRRVPGRLDRAGRVVLVAWLLNGLTPYFGVQYQHAAAMLSNLRIDEGCHNSLVVPEALRGVDPYIRIDDARIGDGVRPARERTVEGTLWHVAALHTMRRNWCVPELRPIRYAGTWKGEAFVIEDLCAEDWLDDLPGAAAWPPGFQAFQKNLIRTCPAACIH